MVLSATSAPRTPARAPHSMFSDRRTGRNLVTAFVLARLSLLVLSGKASVTIPCVGHDQDPDHRCSVGRHLQVVLAGSTVAGTGQRSVLTIGQQDDPAGVPAARETLAGGSDTASTRTAHRRVGSASAMQTTSTALVVAGLIGLLGVAGTAAFVVQSISGPIRRAARVLQPPGDGYLDPGLGSTSRDELPGSVAGTTITSTRGGESSAELSSVVPVIDQVVREAEQAHRLALAVERARAADARTASSAPVASSLGTARYAAARGRALGPTTALWHAVQVDRLVGPIAGACETTVCGSLVRVSTEQAWPVAARDVCPACASLAH